MAETACKYEIWKSAVNEEQKRRDILFCPCGHCTMARKAWHMRVPDNRAKVDERLKILVTKPAPPLAEVIAERDVN